MSTFAGQVAVVTGGANGIGAAVASELQSRGATVGIMDREVTDSAGPRLFPVELADTQSVERAADAVLSAFGKVDILVNVAGICPVNYLHELDLRTLDTVLAINLRAPLMLMKVFGNSMLQHRYGRIVNISSIHARQAEPGAIAYDASKGALESVTRTASLELADGNVLVNAVAPGFVNTRMSIVNGRNELESDWFMEQYVSTGRLPMRRAAQPSEISAMVVWLASAENSYVTGQVITVDGGLSARF